MHINQTAAGAHQGHLERPLLAHEIDTYKLKGKLPEPTICNVCGAVYHEGRWQWIKAPINAHQETCPACHRIHDKFPAGFITLEGPFLNEHNDEIFSLIHHHEQHERTEHPLKRIIAIEKQKDATLITTTDTHLACGIGEAISHAYKGNLKVEHVSGENMVRVYWSR